MSNAEFSDMPTKYAEMIRIAAHLWSPPFSAKDWEALAREILELDPSGQSEWMLCPMLADGSGRATPISTFRQLVNLMVQVGYFNRENANSVVHTLELDDEQNGLSGPSIRWLLPGIMPVQEGVTAREIQAMHDNGELRSLTEGVLALLIVAPWVGDNLQRGSIRRILLPGCRTNGTAETMLAIEHDPSNGQGLLPELTFIRVPLNEQQPQDTIVITETTLPSS